MGLGFKPRLSTEVHNAKCTYFDDPVYVCMCAPYMTCYMHYTNVCICVHTCVCMHVLASPATPTSEEPNFQSLQQSVLDILIFKIH